MVVTTAFRYQMAARALHQGAVIAYPTEAVWGLGCDPFNHQAVDHLLALKGRPVRKGLILVAADVTQLQPALSLLTDGQRQKLQSPVERPTTWLIPDNGYFPDWIRGDFDSIAVRISQHAIIQALCYAFGGPIVSTSANPQACRPARTALQVRRYFSTQLDYVVTGELGHYPQPSQITDLRSGAVIRKG